MGTEGERILALAIERGLLGPDQADECRRVQAASVEAGERRELAEIAVERGYLTEEDLAGLQKVGIGSSLGKYRILDKIGEGGIGSVYRARQEPLGRIVALKVVRPRHASSEGYLRNFLREAQVAVTLNHEHIVRGLDYGEADGRHYFAMEYVEGRPLQEVLKLEGALEEKRAIAIALQVAEALEYAGTYELIHRDVKPQNILLGAGDRAKLCDLGLAKLSLREAAMGKSGRTFATPSYVAPERIRRADAEDFRSDMYSLGATLYHLLCGRPPFEGETQKEILGKHLKEPPEDPREWNLRISAGAAAVTKKLLEKKPEDRYGTYAALEEDLRAVLNGKPPLHAVDLGGARAVAPVEVREGVSRRERVLRRKTPALAIAGVIIVVLAAVAGYVFLRAGPDESGDGADRGAPETAAGPIEEGPSWESLAKERLDEVDAYRQEHPEAEAKNLIQRYRIVAQKFQTTRWAPVANERINEIENAEREAATRHLEDARSGFAELNAALPGLREKHYHAEALAAVEKFVREFEDTEFKGAAEKEGERVRTEAVAWRDAVFHDTANLQKDGEYDQALGYLTELRDHCPLDFRAEVDERIREVAAAKAKAEAAKAEEEEQRARAQSAAAYRSAVGDVFRLAAEGEETRFLEKIDAALADEGLAPYRRELEAAKEEARQVCGVSRAILKGAREFEGKTTELVLPDEGGDPVKGTIEAVEEDGIRFRRGGKTILVEFDRLAPSDRLRFAFQILDLENGADHVAAALYLATFGFLAESGRELDAVRTLGGETGGAEATVEILSSHLAERAESEIRKADLLLGQGRESDAIEALERAVRIHPQHGPARLRLGSALLQAGRPEEAIAQLVRANELSGDLAALLALASAHRELGQRREALAALVEFEDRASRSDPRRKEVERLREEIRLELVEKEFGAIEKKARTAYRRKRWADAIEGFTRLVELDPKQAEPRYYLGKAYLELPDAFEAYRNLKEYVSMAGSGGFVTDAKRLLAQIERDHREDGKAGEIAEEAEGLAKQGLWDAALRSWSKAIERAPLFTRAYLARAEVSREIGIRSRGNKAEKSFRAALQDLEVVLVLDPDEKTVPEAMAVCLDHLGRHERALEQATLAIERQPDRWTAHEIAGLSHRALGRPAESLPFFARAIELAPKEAGIRIERALAFEDLERFDEAAADLEEARKLGPTAEDRARIDRIMERLLRERFGR